MESRIGLQYISFYCRLRLCPSLCAFSTCHHGTHSIVHIAVVVAAYSCSLCVVTIPMRIYCRKKSSKKFPLATIKNFNVDNFTIFIMLFNEEKQNSHLIFVRASFRNDQYQIHLASVSVSTCRSSIIRLSKMTSINFSKRIFFSSAQNKAKERNECADSCFNYA